MSLLVTSQPVPLAADADGVFRVGRTRVTLDTVIAAFHDGLTAEEIVTQYPSLHLGDVYLVIGYYLAHRSEVDAYLADRTRHAAEVRAATEARFPPDGLRERLLARQSSSGN